MIFRLLFALVVGLSWVVNVRAAENKADLKVAVIDLGGHENLQLVLQDRLTHMEGLIVLDRQDLKGLSSTLLSQDLFSPENITRSGSMLGANGILFLSGTPESVRATLVAVEPGLILASFIQSDPKQKLEGLVQTVLNRFFPAFEKLKNIQRRQITPVSLLGLYCDESSTNSRSVEKQINIQLAHSLINRPNMAVLDRWNLSQTRWDKTLANTQAPFWDGSALIDGSIRQDHNLLLVNIRIRRQANEKGLTFSASGSETNIEEIVDSLGDFICKSLKLSNDHSDWDRMKEANEYARMGEWAFQQQLYEQCVDSFETAYALGYKSLMAWYMLRTSYENVAVAKANSGDAHAAITFAIRGLDSFSEHLRRKEEMTRTNEKGEIIDCDTAGLTLISPNWEGDLFRGYVRVLRTIKNNSWHLTYPVETKLLRHLFRENWRNYVASLSKVAPSACCVSISFFKDIPYWTETPEESIETYRAVFKDESPNEKCPWSPHFCVRILGVARDKSAPWLIAWKPEDESRLDRLWRGFAEELLNSKNIGNQADGLMLRFNTLQTEQERIASMPQIVQFLWDHRVEFADYKIPPYTYGFSSIIGGYSKTCDKECRDILFRYVEYFIKNANCLDRFSLGGLDATWDDSQSGLLLSAARFRIQSGNCYKPDMDEFVGRILGNHPNLNLAELAQNRKGSLEVRRSYSGKSSTSEFGKNVKFISIQLIGQKAGAIWFKEIYDNPISSMIVRFDAITKTISRIPTPWDKNNFGCKNVAIDSLGIYVLEAQKLWTYKNNQQAWSSKDVPKHSYASIALNDGYIVACFSDEDNGLLKFDFEKGTVETLINSRRKEAQNNLDGTSFGQPCGVFFDQQKRLHLLTQYPNYLYALQDDKKTWEYVNAPVVYSTWKKKPLPQQLGMSSCKTDDNGSLVFGGGDLMYFPNAEGHAQYLLGFERVNPRWMIPFKHGIGGLFSSATLGGTNLWLVIRDESPGQYCLVCFEIGKAKPVVIPLLFMQDNQPVVRLNINEMVVTSSDLYFIDTFFGIWELSFQDIKTYVQNNPQLSETSARYFR